MPCRLAILLLLPLILAFSPLLRASEGVSLAAVRRMIRDEAPKVRAAGLRRLAGRDERPVLDLLTEGLGDKHPYVRRAAAGVLGALDPHIWREAARRVLRSKLARARAAGARMAALWASEQGRALLDRLARDADAGVRAEALVWLAQDPADDIDRLLEAALGDSDGRVRALALDALTERGRREPPLEGLLEDRDFRARLSALESSVARVSPVRDPGAAVKAVIRGLGDDVWSVRLRAAELAGAVLDARLLVPLIQALEDERRRVRIAAHGSLVALTGIPFDPEPALWRQWMNKEGKTFDPGQRESAPPKRPPPRKGRTVAAGAFLDVPIASRHVAFVLDASGSMVRRAEDGRSRWTHVVEALERTLADLDDAAFNVHLFADEVEAAFPRAVRVSRLTRRRIAQWLEAREPGGKTALFDGIAAALEDEEVDTVVVLSDGAPSAGSFFTKTDLLLEIRRKNRWRRARIDVIDVGGNGVAKRWQRALREIAEDSGGGYARR